MSAIWIYLAILIYFIIGTILSIGTLKNLGKSLIDYFLANRTLGPIVSSLTYSATTYSAFMMIGLAGLTYAHGVGALGFELTYLCGIFLAIIFGPRIWIIGKKYNFLTIGELLSHRYESKIISLIVSIVSLIFLIPYSSVQFMGIGYLLEGITKGKITFLEGLIIAVIIAMVWALISGLRSVAITDAMQALIMFLSSLLLIIFILNKGFGGIIGFIREVETKIPLNLSVPGEKGLFTIKFFLNLTIPWFFFSLSNPQVSQRLFVPKDLKTMRIMWKGFLIFGFLYTLISITWGFMARLLVPSLKTPDLATPTILSMTEIIPPILSIFVMVGIISAAISTIDSILLTPSSMVAKDIYGNLKTKVDESKMLLVGRISIPLISLIFLIFAYFRFNLITILSSMSSGGLLVIVPSLIGAFTFKKGTKEGTIISILIGGILIGLGYIFNIKIFGFGPGVWGIFITTLIFILVSVFTKPPKEKAIIYIDELKKEINEKNIL